MEWKGEGLGGERQACKQISCGSTPADLEGDNPEGDALANILVIGQGDKWKATKEADNNMGDNLNVEEVMGNMKKP